MSFTIKNKLIALAVISAFALVILFVVGQIQSKKQEHLRKIVETTYQLSNEMLMLRRHEKDFLARQDLKYNDRFISNMDTLEANLQMLIGHLDKTTINPDRAKTLVPLFDVYQQAFSNLVSATVDKGLDKDQGHYGTLRSATHELEEYLEAKNNAEAMVLLLTLRRHEKDFMLRYDPKYLSALKSTSETLKQDLRSDSTAASIVDHYVNEFQAFYDISSQIGLTEQEGYRGEMRNAVHTIEESLNLMVENYTVTANEASARSRTIQFVASISISIAIFAMILIIGRQITIPITFMSRSFEDIRKSDDLTKRVEVLRDDEIGAASKDFNILIDYFHQMVQKIYRAVDKLDVATNTVSESVGRTKANIVDQSTQSDMVATAVAEMGAAANEIAHNVELTSSKVASTHKSAELGATKVGETVQTVTALANSLVGAGESMTQLTEDSKSISSVLGVIQGIAEQTNLLALNAAIEAARAGEQGRGFAVVADEVRALAQKTQESTEEISNIIGSLQSSIQSIVAIVEQCKTDGLNSSEIANEAGQVLNQIMSEMDEVAEMTTSIATAVEEQTHVVEEINSNVLRITDIGKDVAAESEENAKASNEVSEQAKVLHDTVSIFKV